MNVEWAIDGDQIEICHQYDGTVWLLGEGRYGKVYKALKSGVQVGATAENVASHI